MELVIIHPQDWHMLSERRHSGNVTRHRAITGGVPVSAIQSIFQNSIKCQCKEAAQNNAIPAGNFPTPQRCNCTYDAPRSPAELRRLEITDSTVRQVLWLHAYFHTAVNLLHARSDLIKLSRCTDEFFLLQR